MCAYMYIYVYILTWIVLDHMTLYKAGLTVMISSTCRRKQIQRLRLVNTTTLRTSC
jgi:hypothetical protein